MSDLISEAFYIYSQLNIFQVLDGASKAVLMLVNKQTYAMFFLKILKKVLFSVFMIMNR